MDRQCSKKLLIALERAQQNLRLVQERFAGDKDLLAIYEPSAKEAVRICQERLADAWQSAAQSNPN